METNTYTSFLIGAYMDGDFWCRGEYSDRDKAQEAFDLYVERHPEKEVQLFQKITTHAVLKTHYPKK